MRRVGGWSVVAVVSFGAVLGVTETALKAVHAHWPQGMLIGLGALASALIGLVRPLQDSVNAAWAKRLTGKFERADQRDSLVQATAPGRRNVQRVKDLAGARAVLGIHPSIPLPPDADNALPAEVPLYVARDIHATLAAWVTARQRTGGFLLLVGPAGAGKTRCLYEVLHEKLPDAPMVLPRTPAHLETFVNTLAPKGGPVVVWLNEIYDQLGANGLTSALILQALNHARPGLIVATIWPEHHAALTDGQGAELNRDKVEALTRLCHTEHLTAAFSTKEIERARSLAQRDPRLREALESLTDDETDLAGSLAAKPRLTAYWDKPSDPFAHAVLAAAITARRLGHPDPIPAAVLEPLAAKRLSPSQRAHATPDWFTAALSSACSPLPGLTVRPLEPRADSPGQTNGYRPNDIITNNAGDTASDEDIDLVISHAEPVACLDIGFFLYLAGGRAEHALLATRKAARDDSVVAGQAAAMLGMLLVQEGDTQGAQAAFHVGVATADPDSVVMAAFGLGVLLAHQSEHARAAYRNAADSPLPVTAAFGRGLRLAQHNTLEATGADDLNAGNNPNPLRTAVAIAGFANLLHKQGAFAGARDAYQTALDSQIPELASIAAFGLGDLLALHGDLDAAHAYFLRVIEAGDPDHVPHAANSLGLLLASHGQTDAARTYYRHAIDTGHLEAAARARQAIKDLTEPANPR